MKADSCLAAAWRQFAAVGREVDAEVFERPVIRLDSVAEDAEFVRTETDPFSGHAFVFRIVVVCRKMSFEVVSPVTNFCSSKHVMPFQIWLNLLLRHRVSLVFNPKFSGEKSPLDLSRRNMSKGFRQLRRMP